ncbi:MAG TPA: hydroxyphenylacetyl-CoA thioesterase PaaI [Burkholderiales bacterium]|nr:hydroxyphenylacetyl-CoA thioesterase PaaI [Burkholderiales bacterium]
MNDSALDPRALAERVGAGMFAEDAASRGLGMRIEAMGPGHARLSMRVRADMLNGFKICHGGFITALADSAFAFACNSSNELTLAAGIAVDFIAPAMEGDLLMAEAREVVLAGRTGLYDVTVTNEKGQIVATLRGRSHRAKNKRVIPT